MKITRYPQSCVIVETKGKKILVDPGSIGFKEEFLADWKSCDLVLITHKHGDHCYPPGFVGMTAYATKEVADAYPDVSFEIIKEGDKINDFIEVVHAEHGYLPHLRGAKEIHENVGYIIDGVYATSDTICFKNDYKCDILVAAVSGHGLVMGAFEVAQFAKEAGASLVIPVHLDNPAYPVNMDSVKEELEKVGIECKPLEIGESVEI
jgi:L-ascorbate metabolism protein UlaG (beta-lactamase superfamily)